MPDQQSQWEGKTKGSKLGYKIFEFLLRTGGLSAAYAILPMVTLWYRLFMPSVLRPLRYLYIQRLGYSKTHASLLIRKNLLFFGQTLIDKATVLAGIKNNLQFIHEGEEYLHQLGREGKGGLIISAHLGNWEVAGQLFKRYDTTINILMYDGETEQMKQYLQRFEGNRSFNIIFLKEDLSHIYEINAALQRNEFVCMHADRFRPGNRTIEHEFLGEKALFPAGPFILASKLQASVCFVFAFKETNRLYHFKAFEPKKYIGRGMTGANVMLEDYVQLLEQELKKYPAQWFNYYDFWQHGKS